MEPALEIRMVWENLALAMALWAGAKKGMITKEHLPTGNAVVPGEPGKLERIYNPLELNSEADLARCISNQLRGGVTFSAMQTQRTLNYIFGSPQRSSPLDESNPDLRGARCSIYLLSTALSQGMLDPIWDCKGPYQYRFEVAPISFVLDASELDGKPVYWEDIGGLEKYLELLEYLADQMEQLGPVVRHSFDEGIADSATNAVVSRPTKKVNQIPMPLEEDQPLTEFLEAKYSVEPESYIIASELFSNYLRWCEDIGQTPLGQRSFGIQLTKLGFTRKRRGRGRHWWKGLEPTKNLV